MDSNVLTLVAILLPLSSMWAASSTEGNAQASPPKARRQKRFGSFKSSSTARYTEKKSLSGAFSRSDANWTGPTASPTATPQHDCFQDAGVDLEAQEMAGLRVTRNGGIGHVLR